MCRQVSSQRRRVAGVIHCRARRLAPEGSRLEELTCLEHLCFLGYLLFTLGDAALATGSSLSKRELKLNPVLEKTEHVYLIY